LFLPPHELRAEAARHYTEPQLAGLVVSTATINLWTRLNAVTGRVSGDGVKQLLMQPARQPA
jgi:hypothetical protein